jgi:uncharacterized integral membrane protein (TIGR00697 family)
MQFFKHKPIRVYELLVGLFVMTLIVSNISSVKMVQVGPLVFDAGTLLFPLAYIIGDIVTEVYGYRRMRTLLYVGVGMLLLTSITFWVVGILPAQANWTEQGAYDTILGVVWRIAVASIAAIFVGELLNSYILAALKIKTKGKKLWHRLVGSSAVGSFVDTTVFSLLAFAGSMRGSAMMQLIATVFLIKISTEIIVSPLTMRIIHHIKCHEKLDAYEVPASRLLN